MRLFLLLFCLVSLPETTAFADSMYARSTEEFLEDCPRFGEADSLQK